MSTGASVNEMKHADAAPIFIVGSPRSGTTLLRFMLTSHSRIYIPDETGFIPFLRVPVDAPLTPTQVRAVLNRIGRLNRFWQGVVRDVDAFLASLPDLCLSTILDRLYRMHIGEQDDVRWGDKTPLYVRYISRLHRLFPRAQFVHAIRDGRDASLSAMEKWGREKPYLDPYYLLQNWVRNVQAGRASGQRLGSDRYLEVRYESLVTEPEETLRKTCAFLNERFEPRMLDQTGAAMEIGGGIDQHVEVQQLLTAVHVNRWVTEMSAFEKKLSDYVAGPALASLGYPPSGLGPFTTTEWLRHGYLAAKFSLSDATRTGLYRWGILTLNRNRRP